LKKFVRIGAVAFGVEGQEKVGDRICSHDGEQGADVEGDVQCVGSGKDGRCLAKDSAPAEAKQPGEAECGSGKCGGLCWLEL
jgi:hypothetical protein